MERLNYEVLKKSGYQGYVLEKAPEKVLQFGEGNFLRAFVNYWFDLANEKAGWNGKCCLVQPIAPGLANMINEQEGLYTLYLRGSQNGQKVDDMRVISSVSRCLNPYEEAGFEAMMEVAVSDDLEIVVSNTTEAGIVYDPACQLTDKPASSFPGKLNLGGICLVAGLGPENNRRRDGTYEYYISEPIVENDAKGLAPFLMAYTELLLSNKED